MNNQCLSVDTLRRTPNNRIEFAASLLGPRYRSAAHAGRYTPNNGMIMAKVKLYGKKNLRTAAYNRSASTFFLNLAESQEEWRFFSSQASIVFSAFTHEAFLNTLGIKIVKSWDENERASPEDKLKIICRVTCPALSDPS